MARPKGSKNKPKTTAEIVPISGKKRGRPKKEAAPHGKGGNGRPLAPSDNGGPDAAAIQVLFLNHAKAWDGWKSAAKILQEREKDVKAALKNDGFTVTQFKIRDQLLANPKREAKVRAEVVDRLQVARWIGHAMGQQLDLFEQPNRTPIAESAYEAGKIARMENKPASPPHDPSTEAYAKWMSGFHAENDRQNAENAKGFKPLNDFDDPAEADAEADLDPARPLAG